MNARHAGGLAAVLAVALATVALADRTVVRDPKRDIKCGTAADDIRKAIAGHASRGRLKHVVRVRRAKGRIKPDIFIKVGKSKRIRYAAYGGGNVVDLKKNETTGEVNVKRDGNRWILLFHPRSLGDPDRYRWAAVAAAGSAYHFNCDFAPNKRYKLHVLRGVGTSR